jgi:hypothetical protein
MPPSRLRCPLPPESGIIAGLGDSPARVLLANGELRAIRAADGSARLMTIPNVL